MRMKNRKSSFVIGHAFISICLLVFSASGDSNNIEPLCGMQPNKIGDTWVYYTVSDLHVGLVERYYDTVTIYQKIKVDNADEYLIRTSRKNAVGSWNLHPDTIYYDTCDNLTNSSYFLDSCYSPDRKISVENDSINTIYLKGCEKWTQYQSVAVQNIGLVGKTTFYYLCSGYFHLSCDSSNSDSVIMLSKKLNCQYQYDTIYLEMFNGVPINGKSIYNKEMMQTPVDKSRKMRSKPQLRQSISTSLNDSYIYDLSGRRIQTTKTVKNGLYIINKGKQYNLLLNLGSYR